MNDKSYKIIDGKYIPQSRKNISENEMQGACWRSWFKNGEYFFEYDAGHLAADFKIVKITKKDFLLLKSGDVTEIDLAEKYYG